MKTDDTGVIYRIWNTANGKSYVGQTIQQPEKRIHHHFTQKDSRILGRAIDKYGESLFEYEIVESDISFDLLDAREIYWIKHFKSVSPHGYNLTLNGVGGGPQSDETRQLISQRMKGRKFTEEHRRNLSEVNKGKTHSEETRKKMSQIKRGKTQTAETRRKLSEMNRGEKHPQYGTNPSKESRQKMSEAKRGKKRVFTEEHKRNISDSKKGERCSKQSSALQLYLPI